MYYPGLATQRSVTSTTGNRQLRLHFTMVRWNSSLALCLILAVLMLCIESTISKDSSQFDNEKVFRRAFASGGEHEPRKISKRQATPTLRVTTINDAPYVLSFPKMDGSIEWRGMLIDLLRKVAEDANVKIKIHLVKDHQYGAYNGTRWNGMIGELIDGKADLAVAPLTVTYERERVVDFTNPYLSSGLTFIYSVPRAVISPFAFLTVLSPLVWIIFFIAFIVVSFILFIVAKLTPYEWKHPHHGADVRVNKFSLLSSFWFAISSCFRQYSGIAPRSTSVRIIAGTWWLVVLLFFLYYVINLVPMLSATKTNRYQTVQDVIDSNVETGFVIGGSTYSFFKRAVWPPYKKIWAKARKDDSFTQSVMEGIQRMRKRPYVFFGESKVLEYYLYRSKCSLRMSPRSLSKRDYAFAVAEKSPYLQRINEALLKLQKNQYLDELVRIYFPIPQCPDEISSERSSITMQAMYGLIVILVIGIILGIVVALLECFWKRCCSRNEDEPHRSPLADCRSSLTTTRKPNA